MTGRSVLYDVPGPRARRRNVGYTVAFGLAAAAIAWFVVSRLEDKGQLTTAMWGPFLEPSTWTGYLLPGLRTTVTAAVLAIVLALPIGAVFGVARLSDHRWIRVPAGALVELFRAVPVLVLMLFADFYYAYYTGVDSDVRPLFSVVVGLVLYNGSVLAEVFRAGITALPAGQSEASFALGLRKAQVMVSILLPQAVAVMLPAIISQLVVVVKDTALGGVILSFPDLMSNYRIVPANFQNVIPSLIVVGLIYVVLNGVLSWVASALQGWLAHRRGGGPELAAVTAATDIVAAHSDSL
ncbi:MAG: amino acid ABC transporter permease [Kutzneria sp.]|nr:amino acid ABC transporter permease [Kutzneria sp.]MBV9846022.1 amino acid ABC transporter permease [Kutzneria sp.]